MGERRMQILEELSRLSADSARVMDDIESASNLDEKILLIETRSEPINAQEAEDEVDDLRN